jgi:hypothetical protein
MCRKCALPEDYVGFMCTDGFRNGLLPVEGSPRGKAACERKREHLRWARRQRGVGLKCLWWLDIFGLRRWWEDLGVGILGFCDGATWMSEPRNLQLDGELLQRQCLSYCAPGKGWCCDVPTAIVIWTYQLHNTHILYSCTCTPLKRISSFNLLKFS